MLKTSQLAGVRFKRTTYLRWWQFRTIDFSLLLITLIIQRTLLPLLYILAATFVDPDDMPLSLAMDATYAGIHAPSALKHIIILGWVLLAVAAITACLERCYKWPKTVVMFAGLSALMAIMTFNALAVYEPYLAVRR